MAANRECKAAVFHQRMHGLGRKMRIGLANVAMGLHLTRSRPGMVSAKPGLVLRTHSKMDITSVSGTEGPGSIPGGCIAERNGYSAVVLGFRR